MANHWPNYFWCRILERVEDDTRGGSGRFPPTTCRCNSPAETFGGNEHVGWIFEVILRAGEHSQVITKGSGKDVKWCFFFRDWCVVVCGTCMVLGRENVVESSIDSSPWKWFQRLLLDVVGTLKHKKFTYLIWRDSGFIMFQHHVMYKKCPAKIWINTYSWWKKSG